MTNTLTVAGDVSSALTYFAAVGLAVITDVEVGGSARLSFTADPQPKAQVHLGSVEPISLAAQILRIAQRWSEPESWAQGEMGYRDGKAVTQRSPFSPRIKVIEEREAWRAHQDFRWGHLDKLLENNDRIALEFIGGIGESAYWRFESNGRRPDHGASRWEMKTRNKGQEFIKDRVAPMVREIADWTPEQVLNGVSGEARQDFPGKPDPYSRTATGFTTPGPTDVALAFVALLGLSAFPLSLQTTRISTTPGAFPTTVLHTRHALLPIPVLPMTVDRLRTILVSKELAVASENLLAAEEAELRDEQLALGAPAAEMWLKQRGIPAIAKYAVLKTGSSSAPERQILTGEVRVL